jgi:hypothetical protein
MAEDAAPYWVLISVLTSNFPLTPPVAMCLHEAAYGLYRNGDSVAPVAGDILSGKVRNLRQEALVGTIGGPVFEAEVETERGKGLVRFLLTRTGLELMGARENPKKKKALLN